MHEKLVVNENSIARIQSLAINEFHDIKGFGGLSQKESQTFLILRAFHSFLKSKGVEPQFEVKVKDTECKP